jgi:hypothetical protein
MGLLIRWVWGRGQGFWNPGAGHAVLRGPVSGGGIPLWPCNTAAPRHDPTGNPAGTQRWAGPACELPLCLCTCVESASLHMCTYLALSLSCSLPLFAGLLSLCDPVSAAVIFATCPFSPGGCTWLQVQWKSKKAHLSSQVTFSIVAIWFVSSCCGQDFVSHRSRDIVFWAMAGYDNHRPSC